MKKVVLALGVVALVAGLGLSARSSSAALPSARSVLAALAVKGRAPKTGYTRDQFGPAWSDVDRNGCDTRNDILNRDLTNKAWKPATRRCVVVAGSLADPYTATTIAFTKAAASEVQIDHVVALSDAWQKGAQPLTAARRLQLANDPLNLLAVQGRANQQKGDGDAATWLPANKAFRCRYVARQITVKANYGLWVTAAERDAMAAVLGACPTEPAAAAVTAAPATTTTTAARATTTTARATTTSTSTTPTTSSTTTTVRSTTTTTTASPGVYYANCAAARAAGAAPLRRGQPGYRPELDRDNDGIACE